jgi:Ser/Thr protein kinase RdoA (MazF antagonist)
MRPSDSQLEAGLERALSTVGLEAPSDLTRRVSEYATSFPMERLELTFADGGERSLAFKRLAWGDLDEQARLAKPRFLHDPEREPAVYSSLSAVAGSGAPLYYGAVLDSAEERFWLFVEWVEGSRLDEVGDRELWQEAAIWLAGLHEATAGDDAERSEAAHLLNYDEAYYRRWLDRALEFCPNADRGRRRALGWLGERYEKVVEGLLALPKTIVHGEYYASNVLVSNQPSGDRDRVRVAPVDWELAATGPGVVDLAALVSGGWGTEDRESIVSAYRSALGRNSFSDEELDLARLHVAVLWLGWAPASWVPPEGQRHDWLGEAMKLAEGLNL